MTIEEAVKAVKRKYGLLTSYLDARTGKLMTVVKAESDLKAIPEVDWPESGISLFKSEVIELANGSVTIRNLVQRKLPELFAVELGRKGGKVIAERGPEYFRQLQAKRVNRKGGKPKKG
ncbi:MAG TPA: hypothetical protein VKM93_25485 [Terriglobia bacterium]|nr:hypothetical protein [Terriglobia bacterium]